jgi:hypothetical protein
MQQISKAAGFCRLLAAPPTAGAFNDLLAQTKRG